MVKVGIRKPNLKSSIKARTTGRAKRAVKRAIIPGYGKKGMGWVKDPKRAAYNAVYHRTTVGVGDVARVVAGSSKRTEKPAVRAQQPPSSSAPDRTLASSITTVGEANVALVLCILLGYVGAHRFYARMWGSGVLYLCTIGLLLVGWIRDIAVLVRVRSQLARASAPEPDGPIVE